MYIRNIDDYARIDVLPIIQAFSARELTLSLMCIYPMRACAAGVKCLVCQFVCLFIHYFLACSGVLDLFKESFSSVKIVYMNKLAFLRPAFKSDHGEAPKSLFSCLLNAT